MRIFFSIGLIVIALYAKAQNSSLEGFIIDDETNEPIYGVVIAHDNNTISFSDDEGSFILQPGALQWSDSVTFKHLGYYNITLPLSSLSNDSIVRLKSRYYELGEVSVQPVSQQKLMKAIIKQFQRSAPQTPYWTDIHQTQSLVLNGQPSGYFECTGKIFNVGRSDTNPYSGNVLYPEHVRRTKEDVKYLHQNLLRVSEYAISYNNYRYFDVAHPLGSHNKHFVFTIDSSFISNNKSYLAISFQQEKHINNFFMRDLTKLNGQMWIDRGTNSLVKISCSFNWRLHFTQLEINYGECDNYIVPQTIHMTYVFEIPEKGRRKQQKGLSENYISFTKMALSPIKKYKGDYNLVVYHPISIPGMPYEPEYWLQYPNIKGIKDEQFIEGVNEQIFREEPNEEVMGLFHQIDQQIKNEIKELTWKDIE